MSTSSSKANLRIEMRKRIAALSRHERATMDSEIRRRIAALSKYACAVQIVAFVPMEDEPDILPLLAGADAAGRRVYAPIVERDFRLRFVRWSAQAGARARRDGQWDAASDEAPGSDTSVVLVPARAFDGDGYRLGRGRGCYDRCMRELSAMGPTIGVAYECQLILNVPREPHDEPVDCVVTESRSVCRAMVER